MEYSRLRLSFTAKRIKLINYFIKVFQSKIRGKHSGETQIVSHDYVGDQRI